MGLIIGVGSVVRVGGAHHLGSPFGPARLSGKARSCRILSVHSRLVFATCACLHFRFCNFGFCTGVHSFPQLKFQISLAKKKGWAYSHAQIEPGSLKNLTAQLKEGAAAARPLRPQCFGPPAWNLDLPEDIGNP